MQVGAMCPTYIRGQAYVNLHQGKEAAAEFQKFLNHPVVALNYPLAALAHLGLGCAYAMQGNAARRPCGKFRRLAANCKKGTATGKQESRVTEDAWAPRHVVMKIKNRTD